MNQLTKLYEAILRSMGLHVDDHGYVSMVLDDGPNPCMCDKKRLVVPNHEILRKANWNELIAFHPLSENIVRSESVVLIKTKRLIAYRLVRVMSEVLLTLMEIAVDKDQHKFLNPEQVRFLQVVPDVDQGTVKALLDVIDRCEVDTGERRLINIFQRRAAEIGKKNYQRGSIVTFPIVTDLQREEAEIFGVKMRVKDKQAIVALFNWVIPGADTFETYSAGSVSMVAPFFDALMRAFINVANQLNKSIDLFCPIVEGLANYRIDTSWASELDSLAKYRDLIPPLEGNQGAETIGSNDPRHQSAHMAAMARDMAGSPVPASLAPAAPTAPAPVAPPAYAPPAAPQAPRDPRAIVINDPNFKPLGGGQTINQQNPNQPPTAAKTPENDWGTYTEARMVQPQPQMPVFAAVGMPPPMPQGGYGMQMQPGYGVPAAGYPMAPMPGYGMPPPSYPMPGYPAPVAYGNMAVPGYTQYPAYPGQYQPQQQQTGLPVFAAQR